MVVRVIPGTDVQRNARDMAILFVKEAKEDGEQEDGGDGRR